MQPRLEVHDALWVQEIVLNELSNLLQHHVLINTTEVYLPMDMRGTQALMFHSRPIGRTAAKKTAGGTHDTAKAILARILAVSVVASRTIRACALSKKSWQSQPDVQHASIHNSHRIP